MFGSLTHGSSPFVLWNSIIACQRPSFVIHSSEIAIVQLNVNVSLVFRHLYQTWKISLAFISGTWRVYHKIDSTSFITKLAQQKLLKSHWHQSSGTHCNCPLAFCPHSWSSCSRDRRRRRGRWGPWCGPCKPRQRCRFDRCRSSGASGIQQIWGEDSPSRFEGHQVPPVWCPQRRADAHGCPGAETDIFYC